MPYQPCVYILTNQTNSTLYIGVTSNLPQRFYAHYHKLNPKSFTAKYQIEKLVYYEIFQAMEEAIIREKQLKAGSRATKLALIEAANPTYQDLSWKLNL